MNIEDLTIKQARELVAMFGHQPPALATAPCGSIGQNIAVLDRGFVYVGTVTPEGDMYRITGCKNIRVWGTTKGLGELVNGPLTGTKLDEVGTILCPAKALIHFIPCKGF